MKGKAWTRDEDEICLCNDLSLKEKAELLDRTPKSVYSHMNRLRRFGIDMYKKFQAQEQHRYISKVDSVSDKSRLHHIWEPTEDDYILKYDDQPDQYIAAYLGRSTGAVRMRRYHLRRQDETDAVL